MESGSVVVKKGSTDITGGLIGTMAVTQVNIT